MPARELKKSREIASAVKENGGSTYYIGGFVRDELLGIPNKDVDLEVHGIPVPQLKVVLSSLGELITIGKSFGVFSLRGYDIDIAVPRKEKNTGRGHRDFEIYTDPFLGVEAAARRRDFTINALMKDVLTGEIVDCFGGQDDLKKGVLRHIDAEAFAEDPLRVLRAAQFAARFGFELADETLELCSGIDISTLPSERVFAELKKALTKSDRPSVFFEILRAMNQLKTWFPELEELIGLGQDPVYHPEGDVWTHVMQVLDRAAEYRDQSSEPFRFMLVPLVHDLGKIVTTECVNGRIHSYQHEVEGLPLVNRFLHRLTNDTSIIKYLNNMTKLHMQPNMMVHDRSSVKATNRLFDKAVCPYDLILFSAADKGCDSSGSESMKFLLSRLEIFDEVMSRPFVGGKDLIEAGLKPDKSFHEILEYAHKLRLAGVPKDHALKQVLSYAVTISGPQAQSQASNRPDL